MDDSISEKPYTDENESICQHYDHTKGCSIKGSNFITVLYHVNETHRKRTYRASKRVEGT